MAEHWMEILRVGTWNDHEFDAAVLNEIQASYDPDVLEAPIVIDHMEFGEALGWVKSLEVRKIEGGETDDDISLWALVDLGEKAEEMIAERKFPKRSVGISTEHPFSGIPYLMHIALLGAANPAVTELEEVQLQSFKATDGMLVTCALKNGESPITLIWESKETEYWYRVRPPGRFRASKDDNTMRSVKFEGVDGIRAIMGKLKPQYVPEGGKPDSMVIQALRFDKKKFDLSEAKAWVTSHKKELSRMSDVITLDVSDELTTLRAETEKLTAKLETVTAEAKENKEKAEKAESELESVRLARLEAEYEHELNALIELGIGLPAFIEAGVHKALVAIDGIEVELADDKKVKAVDIFMNVFKSLPKLLERREVAGATTQVTDTKGGDEIPADNSFARGMQTYTAAGKTVTGLDAAALTDKLMKDDPNLSPREAAVQAAKLIEQQGGTSDDS